MTRRSPLCNGSAVQGKEHVVYLVPEKPIVQRSIKGENRRVRAVLTGLPPDIEGEKHGSVLGLARFIPAELIYLKKLEHLEIPLLRRTGNRSKGIDDARSDAIVPFHGCAIHQRTNGRDRLIPLTLYLDQGPEDRQVAELLGRTFPVVNQRPKGEYRSFPSVAIGGPERRCRN